jgi:hypothetical protein
VAAVPVGKTGEDAGHAEGFLVAGALKTVKN